MRLGVIGRSNVGTGIVELAEEYGHIVTAFCDSQSTIINDEGIDVEATVSKGRSGDHLGEDGPTKVLSADYDVLIEATPTTLDDAEPGFSHVREALERDRHVVLANKGPLALRYREVRELERESAGTIRYGATTGGVLPIITTLEDIGRTHVTAISGALDGTANFILSRMAAEGLDYDHVLAEAQDLGVADLDPSFETDGVDTALKAVILANVLWEENDYTLADAEVNGISDLTGSMLDLAREDGRTIRLIAEIADGNIRVAPRLIDENSPLAQSGSSTAVQIETDHAGTLN
jgi:homoserine dehydrogenase